MLHCSRSLKRNKNVSQLSRDTETKAHEKFAAELELDPHLPGDHRRAFRTILDRQVSKDLLPMNPSTCLITFIESSVSVIKKAAQPTF